MTAWSSRAKKPIEMSRTPWASGGMMTSSMRPGGAEMPSIRGIEKPHTSASTAATRRPRSASATARLVVTDDLPTPPLPDETASTRVRESVNGLTRGGRLLAPPATRRPPAAGSAGRTPLSSRDPGPRPRRRPCRGCRRRPARPRAPGPTASTIRRRRARPGRRRPGAGAASATTAVRPSTATPCDHPELHDRSAQLGLLDRRQGGLHVERFRLGIGHAAAPRISTTGIGRICPMESEALTADEFNSVVSAVTNVFGDPTRREIYLFARDAGAAGVTAGAVAEQFELHPNVARHHLEKLTGGGYLVVEIAKPAVDGPARAAGRPSKRYLAGPSSTRRSRSRSSTTTCSAVSSPARSTCSAPSRPRRSPTRSASSTARHSPPAWTPPRGTGRCAPRSTAVGRRARPPTASPRTPRRVTVASRSCRSAVRSARPRSAIRT